MDNKFCPFCGEETLRYIEHCDANKGETKTAWTCECRENKGGMVLYIYEFERL
jgi:hypothetical protein